MTNCRKCVFSCDNARTFFSLPKEEGPKRRLWLDFLGPVETEQLLFVCDRHFADESLVNLGLYKSGLSQRLILKSGAIPTIKPAAVEPGTDKSKKASVHTNHSGNQHDAVPFVTPRMKSHGVQTLPTILLGRTVSTQITEARLSARHYRSRAIQVTGASIDLNVQRHQYWHHLSSTKREFLVPAPRPSKRPRLEEEEDDNEEEEEDKDEEDGEDMDDSDVPFEESSPEPWNCASDQPEELMEMEPADLEDTKYIVFGSRLKELFDFCPVCMHPCMVQRRQSGTFVSFTQDCPHCLYSRQWQSQPVVGSTPAGDLQLSAAVYFSGGSFAKVKGICKAMNLQIHKYDAFRRHCRSLLEPAVFHKWKTDQKGFVEGLKKKGKVGVSCEMTADSSGHNTAYGSYTITELQSNKILDMQLVQSRAVGGRIHMEKEGLGRGLDFLKASGLKVGQIVTDRHPQIQKYLRERGIIQGYNSGHSHTEISTKLEKLPKDKTCLGIKEWSVPNKNLPQESSSKSTVAEGTPHIEHTQDGHSEKPSHPVTSNPADEPLLNKRVQGDVGDLSSDRQTSFEARQRIIRHFVPKKVVFKDVSRTCRLFLAGMHHNENAKREQAALNNTFCFEKSKNDLVTAQEVKTQPTFDYVTNLMRLVFTEVLLEPSTFMEQLKTTLHVSL